MTPACQTSLRREFLGSVHKGRLEPDLGVGFELSEGPLNTQQTIPFNAINATCSFCGAIVRAVPAQGLAREFCGRIPRAREPRPSVLLDGVVSAADNFDFSIEI